MTFESMANPLDGQQERLDRLFSITPEIRHRLDTGDVSVRELRRVFALGCGRDPWSFWQRWKDPRWQWLPVGMMLVNLILCLLIFLVVLGFGNKLSAQNNPLAGPWLVLGMCGASLYLYLAVKGGIEHVKMLARTHRAMRPDARPALQVIDAEVSTFRSWDTTTGAEFDMILPTADLVLNAIERAVPGDSQSARDGKVSLPMKMAPLTITGPVRLYLIAGADQSSPKWGIIVGITLREGVSVIETKPCLDPRRREWWMFSEDPR